MRQKFTYEECHKEIDGVLHKMCSICKEWFPCNTEYFYKNKGNKRDGVSPYCKKCESNKNHQWQVDNRERYNTYYKDNNSPRMIKYYRELSRKRRENGEYKKWQQNNKDKLKEYSEYREKHKSTQLVRRNGKNVRNILITVVLIVVYQLINIIICSKVS